MLNYFRNSELLKSNRVIGIHCMMNGANDPVFSYVILLKKKGNIEIESQGEIQCELEKLFENVAIKYPVYLSIDGRGILHKRVERDLSKSIIQQAIPNANESDFIVEQFNGGEQSAYISFARRDYVDDILSKLFEQKFSVIGLTISPFTTIGIFDLFPHLPSPLLVGPYEMQIGKTDQTINDFRKPDVGNIECRQYMLGDNQISSPYILPFYHALTYYSNGSQESEYPFIATQKDEYTSKRLFVFAGWGILVFLFLLLLANMLVFTGLSQEKQRLETQVSGNKELLSKLKLVKEELSWKEKFLGQAGLDRKKWLSYFADQIAASVPQEITLEKLELHPMTTKIRKQKEIELQPDIIRIEGITKTSLSVNDWALSLKKMHWISNVVVENFFQIENSTMGIFTIEISLATLKK